MKTVVLEVEDEIFENVVAFFKIFPDNKLRIISERGQISFVSEAEQREIEELLRNPECFEKARLESSSH